MTTATTTNLPDRSESTAHTIPDHSTIKLWSGKLEREVESVRIEVGTRETRNEDVDVDVKTDHPK